MSASTLACLYARYSTDKQRETSVEDQLREGRARAQREGWPVLGLQRFRPAPSANLTAREQSLRGRILNDWYGASNSES